MKVLLVSDYGGDRGGAEVMLADARAELRARGHEVRTLCSSAGQLGPCPTDEYRCAGTLSRWRGLLQVANPHAALVLRKAIAEFAPDIVHVHLLLTQLSPFILPELRSVPSLLQAVWFRPVCPSGSKMLPNGRRCHSPWGRVCLREGCVSTIDFGPRMLQHYLFERWRRYFTVVVACSAAVREELLRGGFPEVDELPNGVPDRGQRAPLATPPLVAYSGRLVPEKGVDRLIGAFAEVRRMVPLARLLILGDGPQRTALQAQARALGLDEAIEWAGWLDRTAAEARLARAWVQAVPSLWEEPFGLVAAEAMMRGTAVVASAAGGLRQLVGDGTTGWLVPPGDSGALGERLGAALIDRARLETMGAAARRAALERYTIDRHVSLLLQHYDAARARFSHGLAPA